MKSNVIHDRYAMCQQPYVTWWDARPSLTCPLRSPVIGQKAYVKVRAHAPGNDCITFISKIVRFWSVSYELYLVIMRQRLFLISNYVSQKAFRWLLDGCDAMRLKMALQKPIKHHSTHHIYISYSNFKSNSAPTQEWSHQDDRPEENQSQRSCCQHLRQPQFYGSTKSKATVPMKGCRRRIQEESIWDEDLRHRRCC